MEEQLRFDGRVAVVTGAGRGLGRSHARLLAARGAAVVVNDIGSAVDGTGSDHGPAQAVAAEINSAGGTATADLSDVSDPSGAADLVEHALAAHGRIDVVVNNAGIFGMTEFDDTDAEELSRHLAVHVSGPFNVTRAAWPHLTGQRFGRIVMVTSTGIFGGDTIVCYATAKAALIGLTRSLAVAGGPWNINVNAIAPTAWTRMTELVGFTEDGDFATEMRPELVSPAVAYLAHESCDVSGEIVSAGGGAVARVFIAESRGYEAADLTPESIRAHWRRVEDLESFVVPTSIGAYLDEVRSLRAGSHAKPG